MNYDSRLMANSRDIKKKRKCKCIQRYKAGNDLRASLIDNETSGYHQTSELQVN